MSLQGMAGKCRQKNFVERSNYFINRTCKAKFGHQCPVEAEVAEHLR